MIVRLGLIHVNMIVVVTPRSLALFLMFSCSGVQSSSTPNVIVLTSSIPIVWYYVVLHMNITFLGGYQYLVYLLVPRYCSFDINQEYYGGQNILPWYLF